MAKVWFSLRTVDQRASPRSFLPKLVDYAETAWYSGNRKGLEPVLDRIDPGTCWIWTAIEPRLALLSSAVNGDSITHLWK